ncbi:SDR family oxidoreductase [Tepidamorphus sp. 3E244]|uniref:SDR family oxidoreductase n=1 Tax=Tepidamorphus sp. 3E244 TaxID=3385498 RepID=UPI0038FD000E
MLKSFPDNFRALVIGASGGIGGAIHAALETDSACARVDALSRKTHPGFDLTDETSIEAAAKTLSDSDPFSLIVDCTGILDTSFDRPEKALKDITPGAFAENFAVNATGPALLFKHLSPLLAREGKCAFATLSARVGSIGDNGLGGWYGYRAAKAALNQIVRCAAIEIGRKLPQSVCLALHPGTIESALTRPHAGGRFTHSAEEAAANLLGVIDKAGPEQSGSFLAYDGSTIPF